GIGSRGVVLKPGMVGNIVALGLAVAADMRGLAVAEPAVEPSPTHTLGIEQVADILAAHGDGFTVRALVEGRLRIANDRAASYIPGKEPCDSGGPVRLAGDQVDHSRRRRTKSSVERVVVHGKVLCVIPECRYSVAV